MVLLNPERIGENAQLVDREHPRWHPNNLDEFFIVRPIWFLFSVDKAWVIAIWALFLFQTGGKKKKRISLLSV